jgi:nicotinamidase-related amidase
MAHPVAADTSAWFELGIAGRNSYRVNESWVDMRRPERRPCPVRLNAQPQQVILGLESAALVIIDMQNDFCAREGWIASLGIDVAAARALVGPINSATATLRPHGVPIVWVNWGVRPDRLNLSPGTQHPFNPNGRGAGLAGAVAGAGGSHPLLEKNSWGAQIIDELTQEPQDIHVDKHRISGFWDTPLNAILQNLAVKTLLFAGVNADHCVLGTLMDANFHGYDTILLEDCTATTSPEFCMRATLHNVRFCFGFTSTSKDLIQGLDAMSPVSGTPPA